MQFDIPQVRVGFAIADGPGDHIITQAQTATQHLDAVIAHGHQRDAIRGQVVIFRRPQFFRRRQVQPQLEAVKGPFLLQRHFRMNHAFARRHPLGAAALDYTDIPHVVLMFQDTLTHVGDGFKAAVRMGRKAGGVIAGVVGADFIQHQKRVQLPVAAHGRHALDAHPGPVGGRLCPHAVENDRGGHGNDLR